MPLDEFPFVRLMPEKFVILNSIGHLDRLLMKEKLHALRGHVEAIAIRGIGEFSIVTIHEINGHLFRMTKAFLKLYENSMK